MKHCKGKIDRAYARFAQKYPQWATDLINHTFVERAIKPILQLAWEQGRQPTPLDIALLWPAQLNEGTMEERRDQLEEAAKATLAFFVELRQV